MTNAPAGWYDAQDHPGHQRYWDGSQWTDDFNPPLAEGPGAVATITADEVRNIAATPIDENDVVAILNLIKADAIAAGMLQKHKVTSKVNRRRQETEARFTANLRSVRNFWVQIDVIKTAYGANWSPENGLWSKDGAARGGKLGLANELSAGGGIVSGLVGSALAKSAAKAAAKDAQRAQTEYAAFEAKVLSKYFG